VSDEHYEGLVTAGPGGSERILAVRSARKDRRDVATLRCVERGGEFVVEAEVFPVTELRVEPLHPGPYRFAGREEAHAFLDEAMQALACLGCDVA
jgi:hypothetical protein